MENSCTFDLSLVFASDYLCVYGMCPLVIRMWGLYKFFSQRNFTGENTECVLLLLILACFLRVKTKVTLCTTAHGSGLTRTKDSKSQCLSVCSVVCVWSSENGNHNIGRSRRRDTHFNSVSAQALLSYIASILPLYGVQWKLQKLFLKIRAEPVHTHI